jgi:hypothetical protein
MVADTLLPPEASLMLAAAVAGFAHRDEVGGRQDVVEELDHVAAAGAADMAVLPASQCREDRLGGGEVRVGAADESAQRTGGCAVAAAGYGCVHKRRSLGLGEFGHVLAGGRLGGGGVNDRHGPGNFEELGHGGFHDAGGGQREHCVGRPGRFLKVGDGLDAGLFRGRPGLPGRVEAGDVPPGPVQGGGHRAAHGAKSYNGYAALDLVVHQATPVILVLLGR